MLKFGWSEKSITPEAPVYLDGQFYERVSKGVETPITVTAWAVESEDDSMIICSCRPAWRRRTACGRRAGGAEGRGSTPPS